MRSAKETGCFPYRSKAVCFMQLSPNGELKQLTDRKEKWDAYYEAKLGNCQIVAVWPGQWRSDLFIIDDLEEFRANL